jgi:predicted HD superfamily hydrolase involved in NAD metabolism
VGTTAIDLAKKYQMDIDQARLAGLLHDCARCFPLSKLEAIWQQHPGYLDAEEIAIPALWHAPVSAIIAQSDFKITDPEIITAIRFHPTGRPGMTSLEKIIFIADYLEPNRTFKGIKSLREKVNAGLNQITLTVMEAKLAYHRRKGYQVHSRGLAALEYIKSQIQTDKSADSNG